MQNPIRLLAILAYLLHQSNSLVDGATVLTSPSSITQSLRLNNSNAEVQDGLSVIAKVRGPELPAPLVFEASLNALGYELGPEDYLGFIQTQAWSTSGIILGVQVSDAQGGRVQRATVIQGLYFILLWMKNTKDFRSGAFEIIDFDTPKCDIVIFPAGTSGFLKDQPSFAHVTQLELPPTSIVENTTSSSISAVKPPLFSMMLFPIEPVRPLDELGVLINFIDIFVTAAQPPIDAPFPQSTVSSVPLSGVKLSITLGGDDGRPSNDVLTNEAVFWAGLAISHDIIQDRSIIVQGSCKAVVRLGYVIAGYISLEPSSNSSASTSPLIGANVDAGTDTATARKKRSMAQRLRDAGRS